MTITILAAGSRGDVQPYLALGIELLRAGHPVRIATFQHFEEWIRGHGLDFHPIQGDISRVASSEMMRSARQADNPLKILLSFSKLKDLAYHLQSDLFTACAGSQAIIYHPGAPIGFFIARQMQIPSIFAPPFPMTPTREYPSLAFYRGMHLGGAYNKLTHRLFEQIMWMASSAPLRQFWKERFGSIPTDFRSPYGQQQTQRMPTVISCSNYVFPQPKDWPAHVHNTGYWLMQEEPGWNPSADLQAFIEAGDPPVYVGFGSLGDPSSAEPVTRLIIQALQLAGKRGVLATGWNGLARVSAAPGSVLFIESAPHSWLFPRMAAVVHHGGAGTTAAGLHAGVPGVIIPHSNDQFAWGLRLHELRVGAKPIPRKRLTASGLAEAIAAAVTREVSQAAEVLGDRIRSENGARTAAALVLDAINTPESEGPSSLPTQPII